MQEQMNMQEITNKIKERWQQLSGGVDAQGKPKTLSFGIKKKSFQLALWILLGLVIVFWGGLGLGIYEHFQLNKQVAQLENLSVYNLPELTSNEDLKAANLTSISGAMDFYRASEEYQTRLAGELHFKKSVYTDFLRNLFLPSLNIWKNPYTKEIDLSILGKRYLDQNPYQDIALLSQWSSIIRDSAKSIGENEVTNMRIGDIKEENGFFYIPISISFKSDSKRAFLLLVDKLSQTSSINNIGLINDFTHQLFQTIREEKADRLLAIAKEYQMTIDANTDARTFDNQLIARYLYESMIENPSDENLLIDEALVQKVVKKTVLCGAQESLETCYFRFRDKYRSLPSLAYTVGNQMNANKTALIRQFYAEMPPLIAIQSFTFDKAKAQGISFSQEGEYVGNVNFNIYGRGISAEESAEISTLLQNNCFGSGASVAMNVDGALAKVNERINLIGARTENSDSKVALLSDLLELKEVLIEMGKDFDQLSAYNQIIKKFEIYRSLKNISLCI